MQDVCLKCQGCCRFLQAQTEWAPCLLNEEKKLLSENIRFASLISMDNRVCLISSEKGDIFLCPFLNEEENKCRIYASRPFECRLYPFILNRKKSKVFLAVDTNCAYAKDNLNSASFKEYLSYLLCLLNSQKYKTILKNNPQVIQAYAQAFNLEEITI